ncbi:unnamed protein product, partial [Polarella glacialis]
MSRTADLCVWVRAFVCASVVGFGAGSPQFCYGQQDFVSNSANQGGNASASTLNEPTTIAFDPAGGLGITDRGNHRVLRFSAGSTTASSIYGQPDYVSTSANQGGTASASTLNVPMGIAFDSTGGPCITDRYNHRVLCFSAGSTTASIVYGQPDFVSTSANQGGTASASTLNFPTSIAFDSNGGLGIADRANHRLLCFSAGSTTASSIYGQPDYVSTSANQGGTASASTLNLPTGIAFDSTGGLCISDTGNNRVLCFSAGSTTASSVYGQPDFVSTSANQGGTASASTLNVPMGIAFDSAGGLGIVDKSNHRVLCYSAGSTTASSVHGQPDYVSTSANQGGTASASTLNSPTDIAFDSAGGPPIIADRGNNRVVTAFLITTSTATAASTSTSTIPAVSSTTISTSVATRTATSETATRTATRTTTGRVSSPAASWAPEERQAAAEKGALEMAESQQASALEALQQVAATAIPPGEVVVIPGDASTAAVMQAPVDNKPVTLSAGKADETGFTPAVEVPAAVLQDISAGGKPVVLVMGFMPDDMVSVLDSASSPPASPLASSPPRPKMASKPLSITLFDDEGKPLPKGMKLKEPILLTLQRNASAGATCAFWDVEAGAWSVEGVTRVQSSPG